MTEKAETQTLNLSYDLPHRPEKVWRALTEPALLGKWLLPTDLDARVGNHFTFKTQAFGGWDGVVDCEVLEVEPHKRLRYTWRGGGVDTVVDWTLTPTSSGGTLLALEHSGFRHDQPQNFNGARWGWQKMAGDQLLKVLAEIG